MMMRLLDGGLLTLTSLPLDGGFEPKLCPLGLSTGGGPPLYGWNPVLPMMVPL